MSLDQVYSAFQKGKVQDRQVVSKMNHCLTASGVMLFIHVACVVHSLSLECKQDL